MWKPRRLKLLWASTTCYRDSFTFLRNISFLSTNSEPYSEIALSQKPLGVGHMHVYTFLLRMADTMTSPSWDTLYIRNSPTIVHRSTIDFVSKVMCSRSTLRKVELSREQTTWGEASHVSPCVGLPFTEVSRPPPLAFSRNAVRLVPRVCTGLSRNITCTKPWPEGKDRAVDSNPELRSAVQLSS
jgi:hypothetical protein